MKQLAIIVWLLFIGSVCNAQGPAQGCFKIVNLASQPDSIFCVGDKVFAKNCFPDADVNTTLWNFGAGAGFTRDSTFIYTNPGTYTIEQRGTSRNGISYLLVKTNYVKVVRLPEPAFIINTCADNKVWVTISDTSYDYYQIGFGDSTLPIQVQPASSTEHSYVLQGTYTITVTGFSQESGCSFSTIKTVTTTPTIPQAQLTTLELASYGLSGVNQLNFPVVPEYRYGIYYQSFNSTYQLIDTVISSTYQSYNYQHSTINTSAQACYKIKVVDYCPSTNNLFSNELCTTPVQVTALNQRNEIKWPSYPLRLRNTVSGFSLYRDGNVLASLSASDSSFTDAAVQCGIQYCYRLELLTQASHQSTSNTACITATSTDPPGAPQLYASFTSTNAISVALYKPTFSSFSQLFIERSTNGSAFSPLLPVTATTYTDTDTSQAFTTYCYQAYYTDSCQNQSATSSSTCPIILSAQLLNPDQPAPTISLNWSPYSTYFSGVKKYVVELLSTTGQVIQSYENSLNLSFTDNTQAAVNQNIIFRIKAVPNNIEEPVTYSNFIQLSQEALFNFPTAFSPNQDNLNDVFEAKGRFLTEYELTILSRTGQVVFKSNSSQLGWDGTINGKSAPVDTYVYVLEAQDMNGRPIKKSGTVTLIR